MIQGYNSSNDYLIKYGQSYSKYSLLLLLLLLLNNFTVYKCIQMDSQLPELTAKQKKRKKD